ncbi:hypothetical protein [Oceanobacillus kimchii]|uniref:Secreted protein n=3 Tax=Bacillaceae TaxID=186817 RepID=A0ABQ5TMX9_9BACI|nr:hypothetical protein [Oceanobacillus kimchii]MBT2600084.1 hypothetical protein [Oceanobacillus sp. ISL-74]GLO67121.1 hypothetical protein MACH08_29050 [Oceanobacillus kimchii]
MKGVIKLCVIMMISVERNTKNVVNVTATRKKRIIVVVLEKMTTMIIDFMIDIEMITIIESVVRRNSVIVVTDITKTEPSQ